MGESIATEVLSASLAGAFSASALYPLEVLKTKMQAESKTTTTSTCSSTRKPESSESEDSNESDIQDLETTTVTVHMARKKISMVEYAKDMYDKGGITPFYAGIETSAFQSATEKALYFFAYTTLKNVYTLFSGNHTMGTAVNLILGCMAEWAHLPITLPLDCWTTQIQTGDNGGKAPLAILMTMLNKGNGIRGMYKGIQAYTVLCLKPAIQYTVFEQVKRILLVRKHLANKSASGSRKQNAETLSAPEAFLLGMVARTIATVAVFPYLRAKVMLQSQKDDNASNEKPNISAMILKMYASGGLGECFQGIGPELTRGVFSAALMMMCKEQISFVVEKALKSN